ncbi:uncharacterized protein LOC124269341 [Haliotis rubra]|uniref:uncharacterized protein LOC124269341 n=1 Tax=Haliotis rubra TaxID=36100 RepID=UPI001EE62DD0|nr:uncharacterized protein LOC124269341 [Haliotis rubra]
MRFVFWIVVFSTCLLGATVDSVILKQYWRWKSTRTENQHKPDRAIMLTKAKVENRGRVAKNFAPNGNRCCKVGEKTAKKRLSCNSIGMYAAASAFNNYAPKSKIHLRNGRKFPKVLTAKIRKCSKEFSRKFEKCCKMKAEYYRHMKKCRRLRRSERKRCKDLTKSRYRS